MTTSANLKTVGLILVAATTVCSAWMLATQRNALSIESPMRPQCGHWSVRRISELLGVDVSMEHIVQLMPIDADGNSLLEIQQTFDAIGLDSTGLRLAMSKLDDVKLPAVVHLRNPNHFVVAIEAGRDECHLFDGAGRRTVWSYRELEPRWTGHLLTVHRPSPNVALPRFLKRRPGTPRLQFDTLFADVGSVSPSTENVSFEYHCTNYGDRELRITNAAPDCSCLMVQCPAVVAPGETEKVSLTYRNNGHEGPFYHSVTLETNDPDSAILELKAAGAVQRPVRYSPEFLHFGEVSVGQVAEREILLRFADEHRNHRILSVDVQCDETTDSIARAERVLLADWESQSQGMAMGTNTLHVSLSAGDALGRIVGAIVVETNVPGFEELRIPFEATVVSPVAAVPTVVTLGELAKLENLQSSVELVAASGEKFSVVDVIAQEDSVDWRVEPMADLRRLRVHLSVPRQQFSNRRLLPVAIVIRMEARSAEYEVPVTIYGRLASDG